MSTPLLQLAGISKSFGGTRALVNGELSLDAGQVTALIGENGAGKSTLVKILTGVYRPDAGEIRLEGRPVQIRSLRDAAALGISVIHQESVIFEDLSVAENVFVGARPRRIGLIDWRTMRKRTRELLAQLESPLDPDLPARQLSIAQRHIVQIARALSQASRVVIMDEPTAALSQHEAEDLLRIVSRLKGEGRAILFISHKFEEISAVADRYAVFRDGAAVGSGAMADTSVDELVRMMVGRSLAQTYPQRAARVGAGAGADAGGELLRVSALSREPEFRDVELQLRRGEVLGVYGLVGAGRSELMQVLAGLHRADRGTITIDGRAASFGSPDEAIRAGIALVPEDRAHQGAIPGLSIGDNIVLPNLARFTRRGFIDRALAAAAAREWSTRLQVKCRDTDQPVEQLSGGNQQKVVIAKWLLAEPRILILDEPTKGIDVGSKAAVHQLVSELVQQGLGVILVSSELPEVMGMSDRILVMRRGRMRGQFGRGTAAETILRAALDS
jgi:rhamnose transport system ATP-binding protein